MWLGLVAFESHVFNFRFASLVELEKRLTSLLSLTRAHVPLIPWESLTNVAVRSSSVCSRV